MKIRRLHDWDVSIAEAKKIQLKLRNKAIIKGGPSLRKGGLIAGADVAFDRKEKLFFAAVVLFSFPDFENLEESYASGKAALPYVPGYLSFREAPVLLEAFSGLKKTPDVVLMDGQGIAHPRSFGLASHVGLFLDLPTIGCAKSRLVGEHEEVGEEVGDRAPLYFEGRKVGAVLRTKNRVKPVYISPGHRIGFSRAVDIALRSARGYRIPEPTRIADIRVAAFKRKKGF